MLMLCFGLNEGVKERRQKKKKKRKRKRKGEEVTKEWTPEP